MSDFHLPAVLSHKCYTMTSLPCSMLLKMSANNDHFQLRSFQLRSFQLVSVLPYVDHPFFKWSVLFFQFGCNNMFILLSNCHPCLIAVPSISPEVTFRIVSFVGISCVFFVSSLFIIIFLHLISTASTVVSFQTPWSWFIGLHHV